MNPSTYSNPSSTPQTGHKRKISFADLNTTFRRGTGPGPIYQPHPQHPQHPGAPLTAQQLQNAQLQQAQQGAAQLDKLRLSERERNKARVPTDRNIPEEISEVVVGDGVERYEKLRAVERRLDSVMMRKRLDVDDNGRRRNTRREAVMRVWVSNTAEGQPWQVIEEERERGMEGLGEDGGGSMFGVGAGGTLDFGAESAATFRVKIEGRLLEDEDSTATETEKKTEEQQEESTKSTPKRTHFSNHFKSITIDFDRNPALQADGYSAIEWRKPTKDNTPGFNPAGSDVNFDTLEFERKGDENINITISLVPDEKQERFKLSPLLADLLDTEEEDRQGAVQGVWEYCRAMGLQEDEDRRNIVCDEQLRRLFQKDRISVPYIPDLIAPHLQPLPPIQLHYTIRVDQAYLKGSPDATPPTPPSEPTIYNLRIPTINPLSATLSSIPGTAGNYTKPYITSLQTLTRLDTDLALLVQKINNTNAKRKFYENLAKDPVAFVNRWTSSQRRDLEVVLAEERNDGEGEEWRRGGAAGVWGGRQARESVGLWSARMGTRY